jgi:hypothetical protein
MSSERVGAPAVVGVLQPGGRHLWKYRGDLLSQAFGAASALPSPTSPFHCSFVIRLTWQPRGWLSSDWESGSLLGCDQHSGRGWLLRVIPTITRFRHCSAEPVNFRA